MKTTRLLASLIAASLLGPGASHAADSTWNSDGDGDGSSWFDSGNWINSTIPGLNTGTGNTDDGFFTPDAEAPLAVTFDYLNLRRIAINAGTGAMTYTGTELHLTGNSNSSSIGRIYRAQTTGSVPAGDYSSTINSNIIFEAGTASGLQFFSLDNRAPNASATESDSNAMVVNGNISGGETALRLDLLLGGTNSDANTINGIISDGNAASVQVRKENNGHWYLNGANTYTGGTMLSGGTLHANHNTAIGEGSLTLSGGTLINSSGGAITFTKNNAMEWIGDNTNQRISFVNKASEDFNLGTGAVTLARSIEIRMSGTVGRVIVGGDISGGDGGEEGVFGITRVTDEGELVLNGTRSYYGNTDSQRGTLVLGGAYTRSGDTMVGGGGVARLHINHAQALGSGRLILRGTSGVALDNSSAAAITLTTNNEQVWSQDFTFTGTQDLNLGTGAVSLGDASGATRTVTTTAGVLSVGGAIGDGTHGTTPTTALTKAGAGTLRLGGANTYSGATTVSAGTLLVNGTHLNAGAYSVASGATFGGSGTIGTSGITLAAGSRLSPGDLNAPGTLTLDLGPGVLDLSGMIAADNSQSLRFTLGPVAASDKVLLSNALSGLNIGSGQLELNDFAFTTTAGFTMGEYVLFETGQTISGLLGGTVSGLLEGYDVTLALSEDQQSLILTAIPEPGGFALTALGLLGGWCFLRRPFHLRAGRRLPG